MWAPVAGYSEARDKGGLQWWVNAKTRDGGRLQWRVTAKPGMRGPVAG